MTNTSSRKEDYYKMVSERIEARMVHDAEYSDIVERLRELRLDPLRLYNYLMGFQNLPYPLD